MPVGGRGVQELGILQAASGIKQHHPFVGLNPSLLAETLQGGNSGRALGAGEDALAGGRWRWACAI
jgi:hypothetical protein